MNFERTAKQEYKLECQSMAMQIKNVDIQALLFKVLNILKADINGFDNTYLFERHGFWRRSKREVNKVTDVLIKDKRVKWAEHQIALKREKREFFVHKPSIAFNDELWRTQWYLANFARNSFSSRDNLRVVPVWKMGFTGKGVVVTVMDDEYICVLTYWKTDANQHSCAHFAVK
ncbi:hypothetical protein B4U80_06914 [Leptotrombidium deliense]|uniref:Peptidase S8 pro-domain domain-containing protein n=1 Tax=Leptotrombidium deliense TaxID=299467 RepID=A0A443SI75_9ACAR|nr:hypothetical protein B4U80_06914 [Leptotrombidium deliense]